MIGVFKFFAQCCVVLYSPLLGATAYQLNTLLSPNPAILNTVNQSTVIVGGSDIGMMLQYNGLIDTGRGAAVSDTNAVLPYARFARRINPKWVMAFDITSPSYVNVRYPSSSFVNQVAVDTILRDINYNPQVSYQVTDHASVGLGFDLNEITNAEINFGGPPFGKMTNQARGWSYGWDTGISLTLDKTTTLNVSYVSNINFTHLKGTSRQGSMVSYHFSENLLFPDMYTIGLVQNLSERWIFTETALFTEWSAVRNLVLNHTVAGNLVSVLNYQDAWSWLLTARYQLTEHLGVNATFEYDTSPQNTINRPIAYPASEATTVGGGLDYALTSQWSLQFQCAYMLANPIINRVGPPIQQGHVNTQISMIDLGLAWRI